MVSERFEHNFIDEASNSVLRYKWLSHYALFSGGYRKVSLHCMKKLVQKYGKEEEGDEDSNFSFEST